MVRKTKNKLLESMSKGDTSRTFHSNSNDEESMDDGGYSTNIRCGENTTGGLTFLSWDEQLKLSDEPRPHDILDRDVLGGNASIPYDTIRSSGPASRPLEFPAPTVNCAVSVSADIIDHRTGNVFLATSVLMRRPIHSKTCNARTMATNGASFDSTARHRRRARPLPLDTQMLSCGPACELPDRAYCIRKKICNTTYGSVRLCVVLKRVSQNIVNFARGMQSGRHGHHAEQRVPTWETTDEMVAIKVVNWSKLSSLRGRHLEDPIKEIAALQLIGKRHPNIVSLSEALQNETHLFCVYPYVAGGDLCGCLWDRMCSSQTGRIDASLARKWFRQLLSVINYLQKRGVCHRDLCLENMMVDEQNNIMILDFGLCLRVPFGGRSVVTDVSANSSRRLIKVQGQCGKLEYMAPEISSRSHFDGFAIDLWTAGIVLFELMVGKKPFTMADPVDKNFQLISVEGNLAELLRAKGVELNSSVVDLLQGMLWHDPAKRLTLSQIVNHPWTQGEGGKMAVATKEDSVDTRWFINNKSMDDIDGDKANLFLAGLLDSYSTLNIKDCDASLVASTITSTEAASSDAASQKQVSHFSCQKPSIEERGASELFRLSEPHAQKKRSYWASYLKIIKLWCSRKKDQSLIN